MLAYFLKINVAIALFYAFYRLFFYKDTFFTWRRAALLCFFAVSAVYPLLNIQTWITEQEPMVAMADLYADIVLPEFTITPEQATSDWKTLLLQMVGFAYWGMVIVLAIRFFIQLAGIIRLAFRCRKAKIGNTNVHLLRQASGPFSFFHWIFIHPTSHTEDELSEILTHEQTHANQWHSIDVLVSEIVCTFCWFNPFAWLMRSEMRINHEYLADRKVVTSGYDRKTYQYHLLGLKQNQPAAANLYNNFSVLPLKNRIKMLNRKRTRNIMRSKYLMFIPVTALLILFSNCTNTGKEESTEEKAEVKYVPTEVKPDTVDIANAVFDMVEEMPEFKGGNKALMDYLAANLQYPKGAETKGTQGRVIVQFIVNTDGSIDNAKVLRSVDPELDAEALRVINGMPKWKPGTQKGEPVRVKYTVPVVFRLK